MDDTQANQEKESFKNESPIYPDKYRRSKNVDSMIGDDNPITTPVVKDMLDFFNGRFFIEVDRYIDRKGRMYQMGVINRRPNFDDYGKLARIVPYPG